VLVVRLYEYCEELNIIKRRIEKLKFYSDKRYGPAHAARW
jgi:hypothetical protein